MYSVELLLVDYIMNEHSSEWTHSRMDVQHNQRDRAHSSAGFQRSTDRHRRGAAAVESVRYLPGHVVFTYLEGQHCSDRERWVNLDVWFHHKQVMRVVNSRDYSFSNIMPGIKAHIVSDMAMVGGSCCDGLECLR